jgi:hypothetical protein
MNESRKKKQGVWLIYSCKQDELCWCSACADKSRMNRCSYLAYVVSVILIQVEWLAWMGGGWKRRAMWDMYENVLGTKGPSAG